MVAGVSDGVPRGVAASYRHLCGGLADTYRALGVNAELTTRERGDPSSSACYLQTTRADLSVGTHKVSGSAQVWIGSSVLQHGSLVLASDVAREARIFRLSSSQAAHLADATLTIEDALGERPRLDALIAAAVVGWERALGVVLREGELAADEAQLAADLLAETSADLLPARGVRA